MEATETVIEEDLKELNNSVGNLLGEMECVFSLLQEIRDRFKYIDEAKRSLESKRDEVLKRYGEIE